MSRKTARKTASGNDTPPKPDEQAYNAAANSAGSYDAAIRAIRMDGVKAGRFLPLPDRQEEIKASPIVERVARIGKPGRPAATLYHGDSTRIVPLLAEQGARGGWIDACVTDPPYELGFLGKSWDSTGVAASWETWGAVRIALKPGAHLAAFAGSRTYHRIAQAIDDAGFEVRDQLMWIYGSGFPKSLNVAKCIDKAGGGMEGRAGAPLPGDPNEIMLRGYRRSPKGEAVFDDAKAWEGWGTALKPAHEPVCFARKPLAERTVAANVLRWATGAINVDSTRVGYRDGADLEAAAAGAAAIRAGHAEPFRECWGQDAVGFNDPKGSLEGWNEKSTLGRWPTNVVHDGSMDVLEAFPPSARDAIRFFYAAKADRADRDFGLDGLSEKARPTMDSGIGGAARPKKANNRNIHPTVKPVNLMRWLCRLVTPAGGVVLDPFMGSGSTGIAAIREGMSFIGCEQSADYFEIAHARISAAAAEAEQMPNLVEEITRAVKHQRGGGQGEMF